jgi:hypothetical protein
VSGPAQQAPRWRWLFVVPGLAAAGFGVVGLLGAGDDVPLRSWLAWFVGSALLHDLVLAPVVVVVGALARRFLPRPARGPVAVGLVVSGVLTLVALPFALNPGDNTEPGFLPLDYGRNLALLVAAVMTVATVSAVVRVRRAQSG